MSPAERITHASVSLSKAASGIAFSTRSSSLFDGLTRRACDQCHARKLKCDGCRPCARCSKSSASCSFLNPVLPKGPVPKKKRLRSPSGTDAPLATLTSLSDLLKFATDDPAVSWLSLLPSRLPTRAPSPAEHADVCSAGAVITDLPTAFLPEDGRVTETLLRSLAEAHLAPSVRPVAQTPLDLSFLNDAPYAQPVQPPPPIPARCFPLAPPEDPSPLLSLTLHSLVKPQLVIFFDRVYPMIPVFEREDVLSRIYREEHTQNRSFAAMVLSMCALSLIHPLEALELPERPQRIRQAKVFMDEACRLQARWDYGCTPSLEQVLTSYLLFGTLFELAQNDGARLRLREALAAGETLRLDDARSYVTLSDDVVRQRLRMFWILAITERAYALQRSGSILFKGALTPAGLILPDLAGDSNPLRYLARLFSFLDQDVIGCWNGHCDRATCEVLTQPRIVHMLKELSGPMVRVFGDNGTHNLTSVQLADLLVTWQWMRNRIWRLALLHGIAREDSDSVLSTNLPVDVALATVAICLKLPMAAMEAHGTGFVSVIAADPHLQVARAECQVEKLFDIASTVTELLQTQNPLRGRLLHLSQNNQWSVNLQALYHFVVRHRSGDRFAATLGHAVANLPWERLQLGSA